MKRMYVIMKQRDDADAIPYDVVSSLARAEDLCFEYENDDPWHIYYWTEVISSEPNT